jgi:hypothetical protein
MSVERLYVEFLGEEYAVEPGHRFTFGRAGDLEVDDNRHLHRTLGVFEHADGLWWLHNAGSALTIDVTDRNSPSRLTLAPGATMAVMFEESALRFQAGSTSYEIGVEVDVKAPEPTLAPGNDDGGTKTVTLADVEFTNDQLRCVVALSEPRLRDPSSTVVPTNREAAARLGWKLTRFNRKLDNVCAKLASSGVSGLHGNTGTLATNRRQRLVEFSISSGIVTPQDVTLLDLT